MIIKSYLELTKPKVLSLIMFTAFTGMLLASGGGFPVVKILIALVGIGLGAAAGAAINHVVDEEIDAKMQRTKDRPLPTHAIPRKNALIFAISLAASSFLILAIWVNMLTAWLTFISMIAYAVIYTIYLKRNTPQNIVWGGAAGAMPPVLGWVAISNTIHTEALLLFLIIFIWTPPHFWALAIKRREEYKKVNIPMLPVTHGVDFTKKQILLYTVMLLAVSLLPFAIKMSGLVYLIAAVGLGLVFIVRAWKLHQNPSDKNAMKTFGFSIFYLSALFLFLLLDHYIRFIVRFYY